ncbi:MAG: hypothetical protein HN932_12890 [Candidatus Marinimicrobia bacterium]|jgi:hypothetical protein|nr:hypothetical protein [Candidatus Neomarinimicrobiota bacterium]MBT7339111.1 hypothetical protein [Candidatus Jacksonbacteria bacterium]
MSDIDISTRVFKEGITIQSNGMVRLPDGQFFAKLDKEFESNDPIFDQFELEESMKQRKAYENEY